MPLTQDEQDRVDAAKAERFIIAIIEAVNNGDPSIFAEARNALFTMSIDPDIDYDLRIKVREVHAQAAEKMAAAGLAQMAAIADAIGAAKGGLRGAIQVAQTGKKELFFPSLAAAAAKAEGIFEQYKKAADGLQAQLDAAGQGNVKDQVQAVVGALKTLKGLLPS